MALSLYTTIKELNLLNIDVTFSGKNGAMNIELRHQKKECSSTIHLDSAMYCLFSEEDLCKEILSRANSILMTVENVMCIANRK